jgi:hypothetical protein
MPCTCPLSRIEDGTNFICHYGVIANRSPHRPSQSFRPVRMIRLWEGCAKRQNANKYVTWVSVWYRIRTYSNICLHDVPKPVQYDPNSVCRWVVGAWPTDRTKMPHLALDTSTHVHWLRWSAPARPHLRTVRGCCMLVCGRRWTVCSSRLASS